MKKHVLLLIITVIVTISNSCSPSMNLPDVFDLKCENMVDPDGINTGKPRLSWKIHSPENNTTQKSYQIIAASEEKLLTEGKADLWNSGKMVSSNSLLVPWAGNSLPPVSECYWKVRIWNQDDIVSEWSKPAYFSTSIYDSSTWKARYIGYCDGTERSLSPLLKRTFNIVDTDGRFLLFVNSLGYHEVYINGNKIGENVLTPAVSQFNKRSHTITYNISEDIRKGRNDIVLWIGPGWYNGGLPGVVNGGPYVKAQIEQIKHHINSTLLITDSLWTARENGYYNVGTWRPHQFGGEIIDAGIALPDLNAESLDIVNWEPVVLPQIPDHDVTPQMTEPNRVMRKFSVKSVASAGDSVWLIDMGTTLTGWFGITFPPLRKKQEITIEYCDHLSQDGDFVDQNQEDKYIASGKNNESFCNKFNYHGFRYVRVSGLKPKPDTSTIKAYLIHTDYRDASTFECSDPEINKIHDMIKYTLRCLSLGGYLVDCPQIERLGYGGDGNASTESAQTMFDLAPLYSNWLQAWADCIRDDGSMPHTAPNPYSAGGGPFWCGFIITATWKTVRNYGDISFIEKYYPVMQKWLSYVDKYSSTGLLKAWPETEYRSWYLGDWATPAGVDQTDKRSVDLVNNCFISQCYSDMEQIARALGKNDESEMYRLKNKALKQIINEELFDKEKKIYGSGSQIDLTYPLLTGIVPDSLVAEVRKNLFSEMETKSGGHFACGLVGIPVVTEWAVKNREKDFFYNMLRKKDYPGYLYMIENGATTTWEHWNGDRSRIHNCYNGIGSWFYQAPGGIQNDEGSIGFKSVIIDPQIPAGISWANSSRETPYGTVTVKWKVENGNFSMDVTIPVGCTAKIMKPEKSKEFRINGNLFEGIEPYAVTGSGIYNITARI